VKEKNRSDTWKGLRWFCGGTAKMLGLERNEKGVSQPPGGWGNSSTNFGQNESGKEKKRQRGGKSFNGATSHRKKLGGEKDRK